MKTEYAWNLRAPVLKLPGRSPPGAGGVPREGVSPESPQQRGTTRAPPGKPGQLQDGRARPTRTLFAALPESRPRASPASQAVPPPCARSARRPMSRALPSSGEHEHAFGGGRASSAHPPRPRTREWGQLYDGPRHQLVHQRVRRLPPQNPPREGPEDRRMHPGPLRPRRDARRELHGLHPLTGLRQRLLERLPPRAPRPRAPPAAPSARWTPAGPRTRRDPGASARCPPPPRRCARPPRRPG